MAVPKVSTRIINWRDWVTREWGAEWNIPEIVYRFSSGRVYYSSDSGISGIYGPLTAVASESAIPTLNISATVELPIAGESIDSGNAAAVVGAIVGEDGNVIDVGGDS